MRLAHDKTEVRAVIKLDKSMGVDENLGGIMRFGADNLYPQTVENIIASSQTGTACAKMYARFLTGMGFENEAINSVVVGVDERGKNITLLQLLRQSAASVSKNRGFYIHVNRTMDGKIKNARSVPFKFCRFGKQDDAGYCSRIGVYDNWEKRSGEKFKKEDVKYYDLFTSSQEAYALQIAKAGDIKKYPGQIYFTFFDPEYLYPLSTIDPVYLDCDTESQVQIFKNTEIRNGFQTGTIIRVPEPASDEEEEKIKEKIYGMKGADGKRIVLLFDSLDTETNEIKATGAFKIDSIQSNINDKLFADWESTLANNIRKAFNGMPAILIDYEKGTLSGTSGEAITQATNSYNSLTSDDRAALSASFKEIFSLSENPILAGNTNWNIKPLTLGAEEEVSIDVATQKKLESQATLKGSVGGVQALIQLQTAVSQGMTDLNSAVVMVQEIYGFSEDTARKIIGTPVLQPSQITV